MKSVSHFQSWGDGKLSDGQLSALLVVRSCDACCWTVFKCYKYKNTTFWNLTAVCQFSLFVCAALIDFRKWPHLFDFSSRSCASLKSLRSLPPWLSPKTVVFVFFIFVIWWISIVKNTPQIFATMPKNAENRTNRINFYDGRSFRGCKRIKREGRI